MVLFNKCVIRHHVRRKMHAWFAIGHDVTCITLDPRLPFPDSVGGIFPGPATTQKVYQGIEWFSQLAGLQ